MTRFPVCFSQNIPGYLQVLYKSKKPFSRLYCRQFWHQKAADTKGIIKSQEYKTWKLLSQYNIKILYILTFQVLSMFSAKFLVLSRFSHFLGQIPGYFWTWTDNIQIFWFFRFPGSTGNPAMTRWVYRSMSD